MRTIKYAMLTLVLLSLATFSLTGCYTVEGMGRDVAATGSGVAAGAEQTRQYHQTRDQRH